MVDRCRWIEDASLPDGGFLVPGCWSRALNEDAECHCPTDNEIAAENERLRQENMKLRRRLDSLTKLSAVANQNTR